LFERPETGERAVLVHMLLQAGQEDLAELSELAKSAGAQPVAVVSGSRHVPDSKYFIGAGKLAELRDVVVAEEAGIVLFNHPLTPSQERNLEQALGVRVIDRNELILDIFAQRAQTFEGKLQVELAQLRHLSTRLVRGWTHLERQKGGIGLRGPGETQLETDRRLIGVRIKQIQQRLDKVLKQRQQGRAKRKRAEIPTVSIVGYTNAGKSTLFNTLTGAEIYAADQLFATLDPTLRRCGLPNASEVIVADTVGFIRHLPHELVAAFRSTLQEASEADLLLHVVDATSEDRESTIEQVNQVLNEIGAGDIRQLLVFNKIDILENVAPKIDRDATGEPACIWLSAQRGDGIELLLGALAECFADNRVTKVCHLLPSQGGVRAKLFANAHILKEEAGADGGWDITVEIDKRHLGLLKVIELANPA
jgi:GTP-binding protein HflX